MMTAPAATATRAKSFQKRWTKGPSPERFSRVANVTAVGALCWAMTRRGFLGRGHTHGTDGYRKHPSAPAGLANRLAYRTDGRGDKLNTRVPRPHRSAGPPALGFSVARRSHRRRASPYRTRPVLTAMLPSLILALSANATPVTPCQARQRAWSATPSQNPDAAEYERRRKLADKDADKLWDLHDWCKEKKLEKEAKSCLRRIV